MNQEDGYQISKALLLVGGIVLIVLGATEIAGIGAIGIDRLFYSLGTLGPIMAIVAGAVALITASRVKDLTTDVVLAVLGLLAGGIGGIIVAIAGILAIISKHTL
jgi:hypothetical protein